ncbi:MAG: gliding motility-associated C-terminal domain-containing protein [Cytophagaceae bacterium]|jgi:gliding motility-associated-like protein|nr:gliding motility-associated C-terminal domain-containing protein [Cytophagaceae bacterium]
MTNQEAYQHVEAYVQGRLSKEDSMSIEHWMRLDAALEMEIDLEKACHTLSIEQNVNLVTTYLNNYQARYKRQLYYKKIIFWTGIILLIATMCYVGWSFQNKNSLYKLPSDSTITFTSTASIIKDTLSSIVPISSYRKRTTDKTNTKTTSSNTTTPTILNNSFSNSIDEKNTEPLPILPNDIPKDKAKEIPLSSDLSQKDPCLGVEIQAIYSVQPTCNGLSSGILLIQSIQGGQKPYSTLLLNSKKEDVSLSSLSTGTYRLEIKDKNGCSVSYTSIQVPSIPCIQDVSFNPFIGEIWKHDPISENIVLTILDRNGQIYYQKNISAYDSIEWNGLSSKGTLQSGQYLYSIQYSDGKITTGYITLVD